MQGLAGNFDAVAEKGQLAVRSHKGREAYGGRDALGQQRAQSELQLVPVRIAMSFKSLRPGSSDKPAEHLGGEFGEDRFERCVGQGAAVQEQVVEVKM